MENAFGWIGTVLIIASVVLTGKKDKTGWILSAIASISLIIDICMQQMMFHLIPINLFMVILAMWNYHQWNKKEQVELYLNH